MSLRAIRQPLVFDIETCPLPECSEYLTDKIEAPSNYKDPVKIAAYIAEKRKEQIEKAALDVDLCQIVALATARSDTAVVAATLAEATEVEMLTAFWQLADNCPLVGFNVLHFDLCVLLRRSLYLEVPAARVTLERYRNEWVTDLADILTNYGKLTWRSLAFYCKRFGIPFNDSITGDMIPQLVVEGKWDAIKAHVMLDVEATRALAVRIGAMPRVRSESEQEAEASVA